MKKYIIIYLTTLFSGTIGVTAQEGNVGIGTYSPDASAALDISNVNLLPNAKKGVLLPRISLLNNVDVTTIDNPANGLIIYNLVDNGSGSNAVVKDTFYFWNGVKWTDLATLDTVKRELLPQVYFLQGSAAQNTTGVTPDITSGVVVDYQGAAILLNSGNNITRNANNTFTVNSTGRYELSGSINYNPGMNIYATSNVEFIAQVSTDGENWNNISKTTSVWSNGTGSNSRTLIISPAVVTLNSGNLIRFIVLSTYGTHGSSSVARISAPTGLGFSRSLKIQYLN